MGHTAGQPPHTPNNRDKHDVNDASGSSLGRQPFEKVDKLVSTPQNKKSTMPNRQLAAMRRTP